MTKKPHVCPPYCHHCPDLGGDVLPHCWGSIYRNDLLGCYCQTDFDEGQKDARRLLLCRYLPESLRAALEDFLTYDIEGRSTDGKILPFLPDTDDEQTVP